MSFFTISLVILPLVVYIVRIYSTAHRKYPPGPRPIPLIGNMLDFPREKPWSVYASWKERYGDIVHMDVMGTHIVVLNSLKPSVELLEKRSTKYSGRTRAVMLNELLGFDYMFAFMNYSPRWRKHRRLFHQHFNENAVVKYHGKQIRSTRHFIQRLLLEPDKFLAHTRLLFGESILDILYDIQVEDGSNILIETPEKALQSALPTMIPGRYLVETFPALKHLPSWFPGAGFKRDAAIWRKDVLNIKELPFAYVKSQAHNGVGLSVLELMIVECKENSAKESVDAEETPEESAKSCTGTAYVGGADTTVSVIQTFFMVMANNLEVQQAAQMELDTLLGKARLPTFEDQVHLPTVVAIIKELLRWHTVAPLGFPHLLMEDDEYDGYYLPKGAAVFSNIWSIMHDPEIYPDPFKFNPQRWLVETSEGLKTNTAIPDPNIASFGFGRRCPGRHFAASAMFITIANILACFDIRPLDAHGKPAERVEEVFTTDALLVYPTPYKVSITPRSDSIVQLIKEDSDMVSK